MTTTDKIKLPADVKYFLSVCKTLKTPDSRPIEKELKKLKFRRIGSGIEATAYARKDEGFVIKKNHDYTAATAHADQKFFLFLKKNFPHRAQHFPKTMTINSWLTVQERVNVNNTLYRKYRNYIELLAEMMRIEDLHDENVGWRFVGKKKTPVPVFFDVGHCDLQDAKKELKDRPHWAPI